MLFLFGFLGFSLLATMLWGNNSSPSTGAHSMLSLPVQKLDYSLPSAKLPPSQPAQSDTSALHKPATTAEQHIKTSAKHKSTPFIQNISSSTATTSFDITSSGAAIPLVPSQIAQVPRLSAVQPSFTVPSNNPDIASLLKIAVEDNDISVVKSLLHQPEIMPYLNKSSGLAALIQLAALPTDQEAKAALTKILRATHSIDHFVLSRVADTATIHNNTSILKLVLSRPESKASLQTPLSRQVLNQLAALTDDREAVEMIKERLNTNHLVSSPILVQALAVAVKHNNTPVLKLLLPRPEIISSLKASLGPVGAEALSQLIALPDDQEAIVALTEILKAGHPLSNLVLSGMLKAAAMHNNAPMLKLLLSRPETIASLQTSLTSVGVRALSQLAALADDQEAVNLLKEVWDLDRPIWFDRRVLPSVLTAAIEHDNKQIIELLLGRIEPRYILTEDILKLLTVATVRNNLDVINCVITNKALTNKEGLAALNESIPKHALDLLHLAVQRQNNKLVEWLLRQDQIEVKDPQYFLTCVLNHSPSSNVLSLFKIVHEVGGNKVLINLKDPETEGTILDYVIFKIKALQALADGGGAGKISVEVLRQDIAEYKRLKEFLVDIGVEYTSDSFEQIHLAHLGIEIEVNQHAELLGDADHRAS